VGPRCSRASQCGSASLSIREVGQDFQRCELRAIVQRATFDASCTAPNDVEAFRQSAVVPSKFRAMTESSGKRRQLKGEMEAPYVLA